jgi:hypothetical protein
VPRHILSCYQLLSTESHGSGDDTPGGGSFPPPETQYPLAGTRILQILLPSCGECDENCSSWPHGRGVQAGVAASRSSAVPVASSRPSSESTGVSAATGISQLSPSPGTSPACGLSSASAMIEGKPRSRWRQLWSRFDASPPVVALSLSSAHYADRVELTRRAGAGRIPLAALRPVLRIDPRVKRLPGLER